MKINFSIILILSLIFSNCSENDENTIDTINPVIRIQSPLIDINYSTDIGNNHVKYKALLQAYSYDETELQEFKLIIRNSNGNIVLEKTETLGTNLESTFDISENFESNITDTFTAMFSATDTQGNITTELLILNYLD